MAKSMCFDKLKQLYDLQGKLGQCAADISTEKQKVEEERQGLQDIQQETQECEKKSATAKAEQSMAGFSADESSGGQFCPAFAAELKAAFAKYTLAVELCISVQISAQVHIPEINIKIPEIQVGEISGTSFNIQMPDFKAPDFTGDIVVPGGGGKLNVATGNAGQPGSKESKLTFDDRVAKIKADIKDCEEAKPKVQEKHNEFAAMRGKVADQKQKACEEPSSLLELGASPEAQVAIQVFSMMKMTWGCGGVAASLDAEDGLLAVLQKC